MQDIFQVAECNRRNLPENYQYIFLMYILHTSSSGCFVAENRKNQIVGYAIAKPRDEMEEKEEVPDQHPVGYIVSIAVDPPYRRRGLGRALFTASLHGVCLNLFKASPIARICLNVRLSNTAAIEMYEKVFGFQKEKVDKEYYSDKEDALVMCRNFRAG